MKSLRFEWDANKDEINRQKHGISFEEGSSIFFDEGAILIHDPDHSDNEDRDLLLGISAKLRLLVVSHTYRDNDSKIRLISARVATLQEHRQYGRINRP